jgi:hypothetical protein
LPPPTAFVNRPFQSLRIYLIRSFPHLLSNITHQLHQPSFFCSGQPLWLPATTPRRTFTLKVVSLSPPSYQPNIMPHSC